MLKRSLTLAAASVALTSALVSPAMAAPADFIGTWVNKDANTRGVTRLVVTSAGGNQLKIQVFGQCHPTDCDWGTTSLITYGLNVQDSDHKYATADYNKGFANSFLTFSATGKEVMLQGYTQFLDNSGRQNYYSREYFQRKSIVKVPGNIRALPSR
ncbi:hypothetical protein JYQ62_33350 [Nostoc sp. UHCC 0702]|nr:hypothetical protein JYQ62_33350 [Nostoc sp. UHCC 0702]